MNRKNFLHTAGALATGLAIPFGQVMANDKEDDTGLLFKKPPYLKTGHVIGITAPAGNITLEEIQPSVEVMKSWGYEIKIGNTIGKKDTIYSGTDKERTADFQNMLDDPAIKAIMCARGGYGAVRIIDGINWTKFKTKPKWIIGFSDITVLHSHIHHNCQVASLHSKMCNSFPGVWALASSAQKDTINSIRDALDGVHMHYDVVPNQQNKTGTASGVLVGGNLRTLENLTGTASDISTAGKILFVEDTDEYLYSIDRMLWNLKRTGKLAHLKALIVGDFKVKPDDIGEEFGKTIEEIVLEKIKEYNYPVCFDFPVGHQKANYALKCGAMHGLKITTTEVSLTEIV